MKVRAALETFKTLHNTDPRPFLNYYFWSVIIKNHCLNQAEQWCKEQFNQEDWVKIGQKIWFTSQEQFMLCYLSCEDYFDLSDF